MSHQERLELLGALSRSGVTYYKSHDLEISFGVAPSAPKQELAPSQPAAAPVVENEEATAKLKELIETMKMDDASLLDKIFPAGAGG